MNHLADDIETPREFERMLRDAGFSRSRAKAITAKGFWRAGLNSLDAHEIGALVEKLDNSRRLLEQKGNPLLSGLHSFLAGKVEGLLESAYNFVFNNEKEKTTAEAAHELIEKVQHRSRSRKNRHRLTLRRGQRGRIDFRLDHKRAKRRLLILPEDDRAHKLTGEVKYVRWLPDAIVPKTQQVDFDASDRRPITLDVGPSDNVHRWLANIKPERLITARGHLSNDWPEFTFTYHGHGDPQDNNPVKFSITLT